MVSEIQKEKSEFGEETQLPASQERIRSLILKASEELNYTVPKSYSELVALMDGIFYNGIRIYSSHPQKIGGYEDRFLEGFVEANLLWRENEDNLQIVVYAESGHRLYIHHLEKNEFQLVDRITQDVDERVKSAEELLVKALEHILDIYD